MGLFANFGLFSAAMIALSLLASLVLTTAALGLISRPDEAMPALAPVASTDGSTTVLAPADEEA